MDTRVNIDIRSLLVHNMKIILQVIMCIPILIGLGCYGLLMSDGPEEYDEGIFCKREHHRVRGKYYD